MNFQHPITGDTIGLGEHLSWLIQSAIRRWAFVLIVTLATAVCWVIDTPTVLTWWNFSASYLAVLIELVVGISMFSQTKNDAKVIRKILAMESSQFEELKDLITRVETDLETMHYPDLEQDN
jgi:hypothetical protein